MIKDIKELGKLGLDMQQELQMDLILHSLTSLYSQFIVNFHMNKLDCTIFELVNMLVTTEGILKSLRGTVLAVEQTSSSKRKSVGRKKAKSVKPKRRNVAQMNIYRLRAYFQDGSFYLRVVSYRNWHDHIDARVVFGTGRAVPRIPCWPLSCEYGG